MFFVTHACDVIIWSANVAINLFMHYNIIYHITPTGSR